MVDVSNNSSRAERSHCSSDLGRRSHSIRKGTKLFRFRASVSFSCARPSRDKKEEKKKTTAVSSRKQRANSYSMGMEWKPKKLLLHAEQTSVSMPRVRAAVSALPFRRCLRACRVAEKLRGGDMPPRRHGPPDAPGLSACRLPSDAGGSHPYVAFFRGLRHPSRLRGVRTRHPFSRRARVDLCPSARNDRTAQRREEKAQTDGEHNLWMDRQTAFRVFDDASALANLHVVRLRSTSTGDAPSCGLDPRVCSRREPFRLPHLSEPAEHCDGSCVCLAGCFGKEPSQQDG